MYTPSELKSTETNTTTIIDFCPVETYGESFVTILRGTHWPANPCGIEDFNIDDIVAQFYIDPTTHAVEHV